MSNDFQPPTASLYNRFNRVLEYYLPHGLYRRAMLILVVPVLLMQLLMAYAILDRYWDNVTRVLSHSLSRDIGLVLDNYEKSDKNAAALEQMKKSAESQFELQLDVITGAALPAQKTPVFYQLFDAKMQRYLARETTRPFWINSAADDGKVEIQVQAEPNQIFSFKTNANRAWASGTPWLLTMLLGSTAALLSIAAIFLRNQIRPILELAKAAQDFGLGRDIKGFRPRGATEVRSAGLAFMDMRRRIGRHVEQRTAMLAGVSHDLRTILTRFKLELAVLGDNPKVHPLKEDVDEMQRMLEDYMAFVKGDGDEQVVSVSVPEVVATTIEAVERDRPDSDTVIEVGALPSENVLLKPNAFRRLLANLIGNAARYGTRVKVMGEIKDDRLWIYVDDNGPGIPPAEREHAFRPFVRLDNARNLDETGTGLGLAIALDIAHAHGGDILLDDSAMGGLRAAVKLPI
jgi:two-component system, OmpR family, osmolarity sensor histidine kinase EnvZ